MSLCHMKCCFSDKPCVSKFGIFERWHPQKEKGEKKAFKQPILVMHETAPQELDRWEEELTPLSCFCADISNQYNSAVVTW